MADVIHEVHHDGDSSSTGMVMGLLIAALVILLFYFFAWPAISDKDASNGDTNINVTLPAGDSNGSNLPDGGAA